MQAQNVYDLPHLGSNVKRDLSVAWSKKLREAGITSFVMGNGNTYDIPTTKEFNRSGNGHQKQQEFLKNAIRWAEGSDSSGRFSKYTEEARIRIGRVGGGKPKRGLTSFTDSSSSSIQTESGDDEESVATTILAPTVIMDSNSLASLPRREGSELLSTSALQGSGFGSSHDHSLNIPTIQQDQNTSVVDPAEVMFGQPSPPPPTSLY